MHGTRRRAASGNRRIALSKRSLMQPILHLLQLYLLLAILLVLPRSCLGSVPICAASGGFTLARQLATPHLPHARATSGACEHAFAGEVAQPQANSSARDVAALSLASPRIARVGAETWVHRFLPLAFRARGFALRLSGPVERSSDSLGSAIAMRRAVSAAARTRGARTSAGLASLSQAVGAPSWRSTAPCVTGSSKRKCKAGSGARGLS